MVVTTLNPHKALLRPPLHYSLKAHDNQNTKFMIEGKSYFKVQVHFTQG
jgi:hypothetical protein